MADINSEYEKFIKNISKIVQLRDDQFEELMTTNEYVYNDPDTEEVFRVPKDPNTLYVAPSYNFKWLIQKIYDTMVKPYEPQYEPVVLRDIEEYAQTVAESIKNFESRVAMRGIVKKGCYIKYSDDYILTVNGIVYDSDYVCHNRDEYITAVFFAKEKVLSIRYSEVNMYPDELIVKRNHIQIAVENRISSAATYVSSNIEESGLPDLRSCKVLKLDTNETASSYISSGIEELYFYGRVINQYRFQNSPYLRKVVAPNVTMLGMCAFNNCPNLELFLPRIISILGNVNDDAFSGMKSLRFPKCLVNVSPSKLIGNINTVFLDCINAIFTQPLSTYRNSNIRHVVFAENWNASIQLHNCTNLGKDEIIENFCKLTDLTGKDKKQITIFTDMFNDLQTTKVVFDETIKKYRLLTTQEEENSDFVKSAISAIDIAKNKNWEVIGK